MSEEEIMIECIKAICSGGGARETKKILIAANELTDGIVARRDNANAPQKKNKGQGSNTP